MKKLSFFLSALIAFGGSAFAQPYVTETTETGVAEALATLNGAGTIDVFVLSNTKIEEIQSKEGVTLNNYCDATYVAWDNGGNVGGADWNYGMENWTYLGGIDDSKMKNVSEIYGNWGQWWAGEYLNNKANRNLAHINPNTHIHAAFWVNSGALCTYNTNIHFLRRSDNDADKLLDAQFVLNSNVDENSKFPILGTFVQDKWVAVDITIGELEKLLAEKGYKLDYNRFSEDATINHIIGFEPSAMGRDHATGNAEATCGHQAKFAIDGVYMYTPSHTEANAEVTAVKDDASDWYYATYSNTYSDVELQAAGAEEIEVLNVNVSGNTLNLTKRANNWVARGEAVLVRTKAATFTAVPNNRCALTPAAENQLVATPALAATVKKDSDNNLYRLAYNNISNKTGLGFYWGDAKGTLINATPNKGYLKVPVAQAAAIQGFAINPKPTHVEGIEIEDASQLNEPVYDLSGRRVENPTSGFYLQAGKKIIVK